MRKSEPLCTVGGNVNGTGTIYSGGYSTKT